MNFIIFVVYSIQPSGGANIGKNVCFQDKNCVTTENTIMFQKDVYK